MRFLKISIDNQAFYLKTVKELLQDDDEVAHDHFYYSFFLYQDQELAEAGDGTDDGRLFEAMLDMDHSRRYVEIKIQKLDPQKLLPRGFGIKFYKRLLELIQHQSNIRQSEYKHVMWKDPSVSENPMSSKEWDAIFMPIINDLGYTYHVEGAWEKMYLPSDLN